MRKFLKIIATIFYVFLVVSVVIYYFSGGVLFAHGSSSQNLQNVISVITSALILFFLYKLVRAI